MITFNKIISKVSLGGAWPLWRPLKTATDDRSVFGVVPSKIKIEFQSGHRSRNKTVKTYGSVHS